MCCRKLSEVCERLGQLKSLVRYYQSAEGGAEVLSCLFTVICVCNLCVVGSYLRFVRG